MLLARGAWCHDTALAFPKVRQSLQETVRSFKVTNEELVARGPNSDQDVASCDAACKVSPGQGWDGWCLVSAGSQISGLWLASPATGTRQAVGPAVAHLQDTLRTDGAGLCPSYQLLGR